MPVWQKYSGTTKPLAGTIEKQEATSSQAALQSIQSTEEQSHSSKSTEIFHPELLPVNEHKRKYLKIEVTERYPQKRTEKENTNDTGSRRSIEKLKESFVKEGRYDTSLRLARIYYETGNYSEAEHWALITNDLNSSVEKSWLIFANAQANQGEIDMAMKTLSAYIKKTDSLKAKELLHKIEEGNF
ncbi:MAG TPA: hypothetical protein ENK77_01050 [Epsilonproteobacteria bacterium]|nr:hypothetical protein [Campylobacterota bacterium]